MGGGVEGSRGGVTAADSNAAHGRLLCGGHRSAAGRAGEVRQPTPHLFPLPPPFTAARRARQADSACADHKLT